MSIRNLIGYIMGLILFVILVPLIMWKLSGQPHPGMLQTAVLSVLALAGIGLSIWSIVYMRLVGRGNPMDAFNHEVAPRTSRLMTRGPYRICRNPMLLGVFIYYLGLLIYCWSWKATAVFVAYVIIMMVQVGREEQRLERDFGEAYLEYKKKTKKIIPFLW